MKRFISLMVSLIMIFSFTAVAQCANIIVTAPIDTEITPTRDFYVVGTIDRDGKSAKEMPLNIRIRINNSKGEAVRILESDVGPNGLTSATYFLSDYQYGSSLNDVKGQYVNNFTPPDIIYDGVDRDSIRLACNKIVVKENYFSAVIYGGATKDFDINYVDKYENFLSDLTEGEYELIITAIDLYGDEVCRTNRVLTFGTKKERLIAKNGYGAEYARENDLVLTNSIVGFWDPSQYISENTDQFVYKIEKRLLDNINTEYSKSENVSILLNYLDTTYLIDNIKLGVVFDENSVSDKTYLYYDIGDEAVHFNFADAYLVREGEIVKGKSEAFIEICRAESFSSITDTINVDFNLRDGINVKEGDSTYFYGVYTPADLSATLSGTNYKLINKVSKIKAVVTDKKGNELYQVMDNPFLIRENSQSTARFEFDICVETTKEMVDAENVVVTIYAVDSEENTLLKSEPVSMKVVREGTFITGYDDTYWGKMFCDTVNTFGETPSGATLVSDDHITRGDFATMINRLLGFYVSGKSKFSDLDVNDIFHDDCVTAQQIGYMTGDEKGLIRAEELISREEAMIILARISNAEKGDVTVEFKDSDDISFWAKDYVDTMCSTGIVTGFDGYLHPLDSITVAEAAALIIKTVKWMYSPDEEIKHNDIVQEDDNTEDFEGVSVDKDGFYGDFSEENAEMFLKKNELAFNTVANYLQKNFSNGVFINKVGNGLEIRDYKMGNFLTLSDSAISLITQISDKFPVFSIKYNPASQNAVSFTFGKTDDKKEYGIVYTQEEELKNKILKPIGTDWYYFIQQ
ncbi:MAG: S-layer homology domain-containing protein [Clostridia bacterium]